MLSAINIVLASGRIGRPNCGYATITGQANGQGGREHGQKCDQLPGGRDLANPEHRAYIAGVWGMDPAELPQPGVDAYEIIRKIDRGEIKGLLSICFNPVVSLPDNNFVRQALEKLEFYVAIDFFMSESARYADVVLPGSLQEEDEGTVTQIGRAGHQDQQGRRLPGRGPAGLAESSRTSRRPSAASRGLTFESPRADLRRAAHGVEGRRRRLLRDHLRAHRGELRRVLAVSRARCPKASRCPGPQGTVRAVRAGLMEPGRARRRAVLFPRRQGPLERDARTSGPAEDVDEQFPIILTTGRVVSQFLSGNQTRRIGPLVDHYPEPRIEMHPRLAARLGIADGDWTTAESRRGNCTLRASVVTTIRPDTVFIPYHWAGRKSANQLTISAQDPISKIPEYKVCAVRVRKADGAARVRRCPRAATVEQVPTMPVPDDSRILHRPGPVHRLPGLHPGLHRMRHPQGAVDDSARLRGPRALDADGARRLHALRLADLRGGVPGRRHQANARTASCRRPESRAASPATTACWPARSACRR